MKLTRPEKVRILFEKIASANPGRFPPDDGAQSPIEKTTLVSGTVTTSRCDLGVIREWMEWEEEFVQSGPSGSEAFATPAGSQTLAVSPETVIPPVLPVPVAAPLNSSRTGLPAQQNSFWSIFAFLVFAAVILFGLIYLPKPVPARGTAVARGEQSPEGNSNFKTILEKRDVTILQLNGLVQRLTRQVGSLRAQLRAATQRITDLDGVGSRYREELFGLVLKRQEEMETLRQDVRSREDQIRGLRSELQKAQSILARQQALVVQGQRQNSSSRPVLGSWASSFSHTLRGKIALVNGPYRFVIVDIGARRGARIGQMAKFYQPDGRELGSGRVEKVYPTFATVTVFSVMTLSRIQEGDTVFLGGLADLQPAAG